MDKRYITTAGNKIKQFALAITILIMLPAYLMAQTPSVSYGSGVHTFTVGTAATLTPTSSNVSAAGYSTHIDTVDFRSYNNYSFAVDRKGYIYHASPGGVYRIPPGGGTPVLITSGSFSSQAIGIALDTAGNIFVNYNGAVKRLPPTGGSTSQFVAEGIGLSNMALDAQGNAFVEDSYRDYLVKVPFGTSNSTVVFDIPVTYSKVGVDADGIAYMIRNSDKKIYKITGSSSSIAIASAFTAPTWLATDPGNNIYVADKTSIKQIAPDRITVTTLVSGLSTGTSLAKSVTIDPKGNMYIATAQNPGVNTNVYLQKIGPAGGYHLNKPLPAGLKFDNNTGVISGSPTGASPLNVTTNYTVYAYNASGSVDSVVVPIRTISTSSNASLASLAVSNNKLGQKFNKDTLNYTITVTNSYDVYDYIYITPTVAVAGATIKLNGVPVTSGTLATHGELDKIDNVFRFEVTAPDGLTKKTYTVIAHRAQALPAALHVTFTPDVYPNFTYNSANHIYTYTGHQSFKQDTINIRPSVGDPGATITYNGTPITPSAPYFTAHLNLGSNIYPVEVTWPNGEHRTYKIYLPRNVPEDLELSSFTVNKGKLSPAFNQNTLMYTDTVGSATTSINVTATTASSYAGLTINGTAVTSGSPTVNVALGVGNTSIPVVSTFDPYIITRTIVVTRLPAPGSSNLRNIWLSDIAIEDFDPDVYKYSTTTSPGFSTIRVRVEKIDSTSMVAVNGVTITSAGFVTVPLAHGANTISIVVTASDSSTKTYTVTVFRPLSGNNYLQDLTLSTGTPITPGLSSAIFVYHSTVGPNVSSVDITPTAEQVEATLRVNTDTIASGTSKNVSLVYGLNYVDIKVTAANGNIRVYTLVITRLAPTSNNKLYNLAVSTGRLSPYFNPLVHDYTAPAVSNLTTSLNLTATLDDIGAYLKVNGSPATSGSAVSVPLSVGDNAIVVTILAPDNSATNTYTINIKRAAAGDATLATQRLDTKSVITQLSSGSSLNTYSATVSAGTTSVKLAAFVTDPSATLTINGVATASGEESAPIALNPTGTTTITTVVTAPNSVTKTYQVVVSKTGSSDANLLSQELDTKSVLTKVVTSTPLNTYTATVSMASTSVKLTSVASDAAATLTVNGTTVASGAQSGPIALNPTGTTVITTVVTAPDGITTKTYEITISKNGSGDADLTSLSLSTQSILVKDVTTGALNTFTAAVSPGTTTIKQTAVTSDPDATITVNGQLVASGVASQAIALNGSGTTTITTIATAPGGVTKTYVVTISKTGSTNANLASITFNTESSLFPQSTSQTLNTYSTSVSTGTTSITQTAITSDPFATITINGAPVASGAASAAIPLNPSGTTTITTEVTAQAGNAKTYVVTVSKNGNNNAFLSTISLTKGSYTSSPIGGDYFYTVSAGTTSVRQKALAVDTNAVIKVNGVITPSGTSGLLPLNSSGPTVFTTVVTAEDGVTTRTYHITVIKKTSSFIASTNSNGVTPIGIVTRDETKNTHPDVVVRQAVSPNGDGINDILTIDGLAAYPDNKVSIIDRTGNVVYEQKGYDGSRTFDGHKSNGAKMQQGTYFYSVEYRDEKGLQRKTGYLVLKY